MSQQPQQPYKQPDYELPPVPAYKRGGIPPAAYLIGYFAALVLLIWGGVWGLQAGTVSFSSMLHPQQIPTSTLKPKEPAPTPSPIVLSGDMQTALQTSCPDASPTSHATTLSLDFCSPKYAGNVAGPVGSHITLIGEHLPAQPQQWALVKRTDQSSPTALNDENKLQTCISQALNCFSLAAPAIIGNYLPAFSLYTWTWQVTAFPKDMADYFIVALNIQTAQPLWSSVAFTLTSSQAPCITIVKADKTSSGDCTQKRASTVTGNDQVTIHGSHWRLGWHDQLPSELDVMVTISCQTPAPTPCSSPTLLDNRLLKVQLDGTFDGTFDLSLTIPAQAKGTYIVTTTCLLPQPIATPGIPPTNPNNTNTIVGNALTFGQAGDETALTLVLA